MEKKEIKEEGAELGRSVSLCKATGDESADDSGSALGDLNIATVLESRPLKVAEENSASFCPKAFALCFHEPYFSKLAHSTQDDSRDTVHQRVDDSSISFATNESDKSDIGLFKTDMEDPGICSPIQEQNPYCIPVAESCHSEKAELVYRQGTVKRLHFDGFILRVRTEEVYYEHSYREGDYHKKWPVGRGTFGLCSLYADKYSRSVVVKQMNDLIKMKNETNILRSLLHKNVIRLFASSELVDFRFIVMEFMPGGSLKERIKDSRLSENDIIGFTKQIMCGLAYIHGEGVAHRDIKPANLLLDANWVNLRIADFGEAARFSDFEKFHIMAGTVPFMAPEVIQATPSNQGYSEKCDIWSAGCLMIQMWTNVLPWMKGRENFNRVMLMMVIGNTKTPPDITEFQNEALQKVVVFCLKVNPDERQSSQYLNRLLRKLVYYNYSLALPSRSGVVRLTSTEKAFHTET